MTDKLDMSIFRPPSAIKRTEEKKWVDNDSHNDEKRSPSKKRKNPSKEELMDFLKKNPNLTSSEIMITFGFNSKSYTTTIIKKYGLSHLYKKDRRAKNNKIR